MSKLPFQNCLGLLLKAERKRAQIRQLELAGRATISGPTLRLLETGSGTIRSWNLALDALRVRLHGKNLPSGPSIGARVRLLRNRRQLSQRELARLIGVSPPTIVQLERGNRGRLSTLNAVLLALGAGPGLIQNEQAPKFFSSAGNSTGEVDWYTPPALLESLYSIFGIFDLDPCSPTTDKKNAPVRARVHFTQDDDGLILPWNGTVFLNPPYGRTIALWVHKAKSEIEKGTAKTIVALLPSRTDTKWWHDHIATDAHVIFLRGRLSFGAGGQSAPFPSALVLWGATAEQKAALSHAIPGSWSVRGRPEERTRANSETS